MGIRLNSEPKVSKPKARALENPLDKQIGQNIINMRKKHNVKQYVLADGIGISVQQMIKIERGKNRASGAQLYTMAKVIGCKVEEFFPGCEEHLPPSKILSDCDEKLLDQYHKLSESMQATVMAMITAVTFETCGATEKLIRPVSVPGSQKVTIPGARP